MLICIVYTGTQPWALNCTQRGTVGLIRLGQDNDCSMFVVACLLQCHVRIAGCCYVRWFMAPCIARLPAATITAVTWFSPAAVDISREAAGS